VAAAAEHAGDTGQTVDRVERTNDENLATLFMQDVHQGLTGIERGRVKYLRVMEAMNLCWHDAWRSGKQGELDLADVLTEKFSRSYESLFKRHLVSYLEGGFGNANVPVEPPLTFGSHQSRLVERIRKDPCRAKLTREEFIRIVTWIDANAPYYGTHEGKKNLRWKDEPDFRPLPLVAKIPPPELPPIPGDSRGMPSRRPVRPAAERYALVCCWRRGGRPGPQALARKTAQEERVTVRPRE